MPFTNFLKSTARTCRHCGKKAGLLAHDHPECRQTVDDGWNRMVAMAAEAARTHQFNSNALRVAMADGTITQTEETQLREFSPSSHWTPPLPI